MNKLSIELNGKMVQGYAALGAGTLWVHLDGETFTIETAKRAGRRGKARASNVDPGEILAPMPGKIIKVMVLAGDNVQKSQVLLVMEAMKMEYTLKAQADGCVKEINCQAGEQVTLGQVLVRLEV